MLPEEAAICCREGRDCRKDGLLIKTTERYCGRYDVFLPTPLNFSLVTLLQPSVFRHFVPLALRVPNLEFLKKY